MTPEQAIEAFGRGIAQGILSAGRATVSPPRSRVKRSKKAVNAQPPSGRNENEQQPLLFDDMPPPPTVGEIAQTLARGEQITAEQREEMEAVLRGERGATKGHYVPEDTEGKQPWMRS